MAISLTQMGEVARILGFPNLSPMSSLQLEYPYFSSQLALWQPYAMLLNRLSQASSADEVQMFGAESSLFSTFFAPAVVALTFSTSSSIAVGVLVNLNAGGTVLPYTTQTGDTPQSVAEQFAVQINENADTNTVFMASATGGILTLANITSIGTDGNGVQCMCMSNDPSLVSTFGSASPAQFSYGATSGGSTPPGPQFTPIGSDETVFGYVPIIHILESDYINARTNLDTLKADVWQPRQDELSARYALLWQYRKELADRLSVPLDPDLVGNANRLTQRVV